MGLSLKTAAERFSADLFSVWDPATDTFGLPTRQGKRMRIDRFTTIYHRPTRRAYLRLLDRTYPASGVLRKDGTGEIYMVSATLNSDVADGNLIYENLRMAHLAQAPSGGHAVFTKVRTLGTGTDLGAVDLTDTAPAYLDLELQGTAAIGDTSGEMTGRFMITHSPNVLPQSGDYFTFDGRTFLITTPYADGGLSMCRASDIPPAYETCAYLSRSSTGGYNPTTGMVTSPTTSLAFSGIVNQQMRTDKDGGATSSAPERLELYVYERHVGFQFEVGNQVTVRGQTYFISTITARREDRQWELVLTR
jgi:hypothetical protein